MTQHVVCQVEELGPGDRIITEIEGREIAVFNVDGEYTAVLNFCVHQGGPACEGKVSGTVDDDPREWEFSWTKDGEIVACPWHGWEFDLFTGEYLSDPTYRIPTYEATATDGEIVVSMDTSATDS
ncbi:MAG: Rieske (2Fe-2S) protein [Salinirussus sp.]